MRRTVAIPLVGTLLLATLGCSKPKVWMPPRIDLQRYGTLGMIEFHSPGSFNYPDSSLARMSEPGTLPPKSEFTYYSFVTLTTLGYGEINPASPLAQVMAMLEAIIGQLYLVILVARLVALEISQSGADRLRD